MNSFIILLVLSYLLSNSLLAKESDTKFYFERDLRISKDYYEGPNLIYDCQIQAYICINQESFDGCKSHRKRALLDHMVKLPCAPLKRYGSNKECFKAQANYLATINNKGFCLERSTTGIRD